MSDTKYQEYDCKILEVRRPKQGIAEINWPCTEICNFSLKEFVTKSKSLKTKQKKNNKKN